jgi:hypothetical protein
MCSMQIGLVCRFVTLVFNARFVTSYHCSVTRFFASIVSKWHKRHNFIKKCIFSLTNNSPFDQEFIKSVFLHSTANYALCRFKILAK